MKRRSGFTLIELLVVVAIVAILAGILFPALTRARKAAWRSGCISNMKQFAGALQLYVEDNQGNLPQANNIWYINMSSGGTQKFNYFEELFPYMKSAGAAICPSKPITYIKNSLRNLWYVKVSGQEQPSKWYGATYTPTMWPWKQGDITPTSFALVVWSQNERLVNLDTVDYRAQYGAARRSEAVILFCVSGTWTWGWAEKRPGFEDGLCRGSHEGGTPALFADLHVSFVKPEQVGRL